MKQSDTYFRIRRLTQKINQKHPYELGLMRIYIFDDGSGGFKGIEDKHYFEYQFSNLRELKRLFKGYGV